MKGELKFADMHSGQAAAGNEGFKKLMATRKWMPGSLSKKLPTWRRANKAKTCPPAANRFFVMPRAYMRQTLNKMGFTASN